MNMNLSNTDLASLGHGRALSDTKYSAGRPHLPLGAQPLLGPDSSASSPREPADVSPNARLTPLLKGDLASLGHGRASLNTPYTGREIGHSRSALSIARQFGHTRSMVNATFLGEFHTVSGASRAVRHDVLRRLDLDDDYAPQ